MTLKCKLAAARTSAHESQSRDSESWSATRSSEALRSLLASRLWPADSRRETQRSKSDRPAHTRIDPDTSEQGYELTLLPILPARNGGDNGQRNQTWCPRDACSFRIAKHREGEAYPSKPVRMIVPWPAGGVADVVTRRTTPHLEQVLGQPFVVENRGAPRDNWGRCMFRGPLLMVTRSCAPITLVSSRRLPFPVSRYTTRSRTSHRSPCRAAASWRRSCQAASA